MKKYNLPEEITPLVEEPAMPYLVSYSQRGIPFQLFENQSNKIPFNQNEWSNLLHLSERTFQRYKKENKKFESIYAEKILEVLLLFKRGKEVLGSNQAFYDWLHVSNIALGDVEPISIIDNTFGIKMVQDVLGRIEHGIFS
ncbi:MAG: DUF2384 domain-containing protein [Flavobacteriales bacterium]|nr:DUF2384 domain-containing protein [Flavobacteriales bacterium]